MNIYIVILEIALVADDYIYGYQNISDVPLVKLAEIFDIDLNNPEWIIEGHMLNRSNYLQHKDFLHSNVCRMDVDLFEYTLRVYATTNDKIRELYLTPDQMRVR